MNLLAKKVLGFLIRYYWLIRKSILKFFGLEEINEAIRSGKIKRILVTRFQCMGDMIVFIPFLRELRKNFPDSRISVLAEEKLGIKTLKGCPYINEVIPFKYEKSWLRRLREILRLRRRKLDLFIISSAEAGFAYVGAFIGVKYIVGFDKKIRFGQFRAKEDPSLLDVCVKFDPHQNELSQNLKLLSSLGFNNIVRYPEYWLNRSDNSYIQNLLYSNLRIPMGKVLVGLHPGSRQPTKHWAAQKFAQLADLLVENFRAEIILIGSCDEVDLSLTISDIMEHKPVILNGRTTIPQLAALMSELSLFICNDSGPMHMAVALGLFVVSLFGPGEVAQWNCYSGLENVTIIRHEISCSPCYEISCPSHKCMESITVAEVYEAARKILEEKKYEGVAYFRH